ncbi:hypothetical protein GOP47_0027724 [Adiantum capillus-veneris]|nr:hypothetical protein GOP47_0027724 [Adiantum capillus-veneris]
MTSSSSSSRSDWLTLRWLLLTFLASTGLIYLFFSSPAAAPLPGGHSYHGEIRFLEVPQIAWGLNNQKIALARALLTARFLNRSLLLPSLSASLTYKDTTHIAPLPLDRLFSLAHFNKHCKAFVSITKPSAGFFQRHSPFNVSKGSGRRWTKERDLQQLLECRAPQIHSHTLLRISGKNPFLWHDHWPARDYARIFQCLVLVKNLSAEVDHIVSKLKQKSASLHSASGYVAVHMRVEVDWMIHCRKTEERMRAQQGKLVNICSSKQEIMNRVNRIRDLQRPAMVYLAVADVLLEDRSLLVGNSFSTFSSLIALERTLKILATRPADPCSGHAYLSFAYNVQDASGGPQLWVTNLSDVSLQTISYGTNEIVCDASMLALESF